MFYGTYQLMMDRYKPDFPQSVESDVPSDTEEKRARESSAEAGVSSADSVSGKGNAADDTSTDDRRDPLAA